MPRTWPSVRLGEVLSKSEEWAEIQPDAQYRQVTVRLWGQGVVLRAEQSGDRIAAKRIYIVRPQQFIVSRIDARNGAFGLVPDSLDGAVVSNDFPVFNIDKARLLPRFLEWMSKTKFFVDLCKAASEGTTNRVRLQVDRFLATEIPVPPLPEQRRIVARIEELAALIEEARALRAQAREEAGAVLSAAQAKILTEIRLGGIPRARLERKATKIGSGSTPKGGRNIYDEKGIPFIRSMNVLMNRFSHDGLVFISTDIDRTMAGTRVMPRDVLLNITGASIGRVTCAPEQVCPANVNQHVSIIRPTPDLEPRFLMYWLSQPLVQQEIFGIQKGATRQALTKAQIEALEIPVPPLPEQRRIVAHLNALQSEVDELTALQDATQADLDALLPSVLHRAFRGEL